MNKFIILGVTALLETYVMYLFYGPYERLNVYWTVIVLLIVINVTFLIIIIYYRKELFSSKKIMMPSLAFGVLLVMIFSYSRFQFNYVILPSQFFVTDVFYIGYEYSDFEDDVRIEYYARDYYGEDEIYRYSYDKDEIAEFLEFFRDVELLPSDSYESLGNPNVFRDWENDIHVMIRNMDSDDPDSGYYVFSIDIVDTSNYVLKYTSGGTVYIYELPEGLREFVLEHMYED